MTSFEDYRRPVEQVGGKAWVKNRGRNGHPPSLSRFLPFLRVKTFSGELVLRCFPVSTGFFIPDCDAVEMPEETLMLAEAALRNMKSKSEISSGSDRDSMYVAVSPSGTITFRYDYPLNSSREALVFGQCGPDGISMAVSRALLEQCVEREDVALRELRECLVRFRAC